jgi:hypothetical protein
LQNLNKALKQIKRAKASIKLKSQFCYNNINIINFVYNFKGKSLVTIKVNKILKAKSFLGICIYYKI